MLVSLLTQLRSRQLTDDAGAEEALLGMLPDLGSAGENLRRAGARHAADGGPLDDVELAGAELLRLAVAVDQKLRPMLSTVKLYYAVLWGRTRFSDDENGEDLDEADDSHLAWMLDTCLQQLEVRLDGYGKTSEGLSGDGRASAVVDDRMRLIDLDCDPFRLDDPACRASLIEAVNAGVEPVFRRQAGMLDALMAPEPEEPEPPPAEDLARAAAAQGVAEGFEGITIVQEELTELLPQISRGDELPRLGVEIETLTDFVQEDVEQLGRHLPTVLGCRGLLADKFRDPDSEAAALEGVGGLEPLFLVEGLDDVAGMVGHDAANAAREVIETAADEFQRQVDDAKSRRRWQAIAQRVRGHVAEIEERTFEGRSQDGAVVARARGNACLVDLQLVADRPGEPADLSASTVEAINEALAAAKDAATHERTSGTLQYMVPCG